MMNNYYLLSSNGFMYGMSNIPYMATTHNENGRYISFFTNVDECLDMFDANVYDLFEDFNETHFEFGLNVFEQEVVSEATNLKLPLDSEKDLKDLNYFESLEKINKVDHVDLWIDPQLERPDKYSSCWIWVELPKEIEGIKYVPIIIHTTGGVSVHPYFHKYFLRSFDKRTRHLILGFCYIYGPPIARAGNMKTEKDKDYTDSEKREFMIWALRHKDDDAPKRINMGPDRNVSARFRPSIEDYDRWIKSFKDDN